MRACDPRKATLAQPLRCAGSFLALFANHMNTFEMFIKGPMLHITRGVARVTAQKEPWVSKLLLVMLSVLSMLINAMIIEEPSRSISKSLSRNKMLPRLEFRRLVPCAT